MTFTFCLRNDESFASSDEKIQCFTLDFCLHFFFLSFLPHSFSDMIATLELVVVGVDQTAKM